MHVFRVKPLKLGGHLLQQLELLRRIQWSFLNGCSRTKEMKCPLYGRQTKGGFSYPVASCVLSFFKKKNFIYLSLAVLGLRFYARAFSSCSERGPLFIAVRGPLTVAEHRLQTHRLSNCGSRA